MTAAVRFCRFSDRDAMAGAAAAWLAGVLAPSRGVRRVALAGGQTPLPVYELLRDMPLEWGRVTFLPTDERCVEDGHPRSNVGMLRRVLGEDKRILPLVEGARMAGAEAVEAVLLGAGADGHVASLFPRTAVDDGSGAEVRRVAPAGQPEARLSLPLRALVAAPALLLVLSGEDKLGVLAGALAGEEGGGELAELAGVTAVEVEGAWHPLRAVLVGRLRAFDEGGGETLVYYAD